MTSHGFDFIARADLRDTLAAPLHAAQRHVERAARVLELARSRTDRPLHRRLLDALLTQLPPPVQRWLPGARRRLDRDLILGMESLLHALRASAEWQRARIDYLEAQLLALAAPRSPRPWLAMDERPVLLLGTGGGGTRLLAEAAVRSGVLLGTRVNESFDSVEWAPLVYELALQAGARAELPRGAHTQAAILERAQQIHASSTDVHGRWGIKLPELMLVLPLFLDAFPRAQVVFMVRHPLAAAFRRHHITTDPEHPLGRVVLEAAYRADGRAPNRAARDPQYLRNAIAWRFQVERIHRLLKGLPSERVLRLRLEEFESDANETMRRLAAFMERPVAGVAVRIDEGRRSARPGRACRAEIMAICGSLAQELGYADA